MQVSLFPLPPATNIIQNQIILINSLQRIIVKPESILYPHEGVRAADHGLEDDNYVYAHFVHAHYNYVNFEGNVSTLHEQFPFPTLNPGPLSPGHSPTHPRHTGDVAQCCCCF